VVEGLLLKVRHAGAAMTLARLEELKTYSPSMSVYAFDLLLAKRV